jgi:hypothetical protein
LFKKRFGNLGPTVRLRDSRSRFCPKRATGRSCLLHFPTRFAWCTGAAARRRLCRNGAADSESPTARKSVPPVGAGRRFEVIHPSERWAEMASGKRKNKGAWRAVYPGRRLRDARARQLNSPALPPSAY